MANVSEESLKQILRKSSNFNGNFERHELIPLSETPVGFLADHFILRIHLDSSKVKDFFFKAVPKKVEKRVEYLDETGFFSKEVKVYQSLIPELLNFSSLSWAPKCFHAMDGEFIVMEILADYKIKSTKNLVFDFDHLKIAAATLAVFHASSVIFEEKTGRKIGKEYLEMLEENAYPQKIGHIRQQGLENAIKVLSELVKLIPKFRDSPNLEKIIENFPKTIRKIYKFAETSKKFKNVFSHGDLWVNNFMFKYENEKPIACKFIDFQLARFSPPAFDLAQLIYINSTKDFRVDFLDDILNTYCDVFEMELKKAKIDSKILPKTEIIESFKEFHLAGLIEAAVFGHLTLLPSNLSSTILTSSEEYDKFINQSRVETCLRAFNEDYYSERLTEILTEIVDSFILE
jgi:hypothetical protein